jgi:hypothetical protein
LDGYYCNFTYCINSDNSSIIAEAIIELLEKEKDCCLLPNLPYLLINIEKLRLRGIWERPPLIIIGLAKGREDWTIIKTYPNEWLFLRSPGTETPRLSLLAKKLKCDAFFYRVVDDLDGVLLETNKDGEFRFDLNRYPLFNLIEVPNFIREAVKVNSDIVEKYQETLLQFELNQKSKNFDPNLHRQLLNSLAFDFEESSAESIDRALAEAIDISQNFWECYDFSNRVYKNFQELEQMDVKLLYFLPSDNYLMTLPSY